MPRSVSEKAICASNRWIGEPEQSRSICPDAFSEFWLNWPTRIYADSSPSVREVGMGLGTSRRLLGQYAAFATIAVN